jgi:esterase/lipase
MALTNDLIIAHPIQDSSLPFPEYISRCQAIIRQHRSDLTSYPGVVTEQMIAANSPFEFYPAHPVHQESRLKYGVLLIHGLFDCPFSMRDIASKLQVNNILARSILLPGHGTKPDDLLYTTYHDWLQAVHYGINSLRRDVEHIFLVGFSTGAALSIYHSLQDQTIAGIILLSPAIQIKNPVNIAMSWYQAIRWMNKSNVWAYREEETDYTKYHSVAFNPVIQVTKLTAAIRQLVKQRSLSCPLLMVVSKEDETISSQAAIRFFLRFPQQNNRLIVYTHGTNTYTDSRITVRNGYHPDLHINHLSHVCIPFAPDNAHYGQSGDYIHASRLTNHDCLYGAYNRIETNIYDLLYCLKISKQRRRELTFNPDFEFMADAIVHFIHDT